MIIKGLENVHPEAAFIVVRDFNRTNMKKVLPKYHQHSDVKFAEDTTIVGLITDSDESAYREEVDTLTTWCQDNNLSFNVSKTKEMIVDYRRRQGRSMHPYTSTDPKWKRSAASAMISPGLLIRTRWSKRPGNASSS